MDDLFEKSDRLQKQAYEIIHEIGLNQKWAQVGTPILVGSARFGLMVTPNIDFEIYCAKPDIREGFDTVRKFAEVPGVKQIQYLNFMDNPKDPGLYWHIYYEDRKGILWDIDNWLVPNDHPHAGMANRFADAMSKSLTNQTRRNILEIKSALLDKPKTRGIDIYKAVLAGGVKDVAQFQGWIKANPPADGIEVWQPISDL